MVKFFGFISILIFCFVCSCDHVQTHRVKIQKTNDGFQLLRNGKPYYICGAGIENQYDVLAQCGGNSIRTWGVDQLDDAFHQAEKFDLTVCAGLWLEQERQGFDYSDADAVNKQFDELKEVIQKYKDHPALLMWGIGNEMDLRYTNHAVWDAVEQVARYIHEVDGKHPTMTATAFIEKEEVELIQSRCPHIDLLCVNAYAGLPVLSKFLRDFGWKKPYILGEWGTFGHWEVSKTKWNEPIEFTSSEKASLYLKEYNESIVNDPRCLGGYVFFWGAKQERTPTWYGMFSADGKKTECVDVMHYLWKNCWPDERAPLLDSLRIDGLDAHTSIKLEPNTIHDARVWSTDPDKDLLTFKWEILHETTDKRTGGDEEVKPPAVDGLVMKQADSSLTFHAPDDDGPYRLFVYVYDENGSVAHANIPFYVENEN